MGLEGSKSFYLSAKRMPTILTLEMAGESISDGLSEQRITEIALSQLPADEMDVHTVRKDFLSALDANEKFVYKDVSDLIL